MFQDNNPNTIVPHHFARAADFIHPKLRTLNAVLLTLKLITLTLRRLRRACRAQQALPEVAIVTPNFVEDAGVERLIAGQR